MEKNKFLKLYLAIVLLFSVAFPGIVTAESIGNYSTVNVIENWNQQLADMPSHSKDPYFFQKAFPNELTNFWKEIFEYAQKNGYDERKVEDILQTFKGNIQILFPL